MEKNKIKYKILSFFLTVILFMNIILPDITVPAAEASEKIYINSAKDLISMAKKCSLDTWSQGKTVLLNNDIDLSGKEFISIPTFGGIFDGQGHTISGLSLTDYSSPQGLFRYVQEGGLVKRLTVKGEVIPTGVKSTMGGVAGSNSGTLQNCTFIGTIRGEKYTGGIVGINEASGVISNCSTQGTVYAEHYAGGIAGENLGTILLSSNTAGINTTVTESTFSLEGLQDISPESLTSFSEEDIADVTDVGGIAGHSAGIIQSCTNSGAVGYQHVGYNTGGIVGRQSGYINDCTNSGEVNGRKDVGGIAGQIEPFGTWQLSGDSLGKLRKEMDTLQGLIDNALNDAKGSSSSLSAQLATTQEYMTDAQAAGEVLADQTVSWLNENIGSINNISARITQTLVELTPIMNSVSAAAEDMEKSIGQYKTAAEHLEAGADNAQTGIDTLYPALDKLNTALGNTKIAADNISAALTSLKAGMGDSEAVEAGLAKLQTGITGFLAAAGIISDAAGALLDATDTLENSGVWKKNLSLLQEGAKELVTAADDAAAALQAISDALTALRGNFNQEELEAALKSLNGALNNLASASEKSASGFEKIASGLEKVANAYGDNEETQQAWEKIEEGMQNVTDGIGDGSVIDYPLVTIGMGKIMDGLNILMENTDSKAFQKGLEEIYEGVEFLEGTVEDMQAAANNLQDMIEHLQAVSDSGQREKNLKALMQGFSDLASATRDSVTASSKINEALNNLLQSEEVKAYGAALTENLRKISVGVSNGIDAMEAISTAAAKLSEQIDLKKLKESTDYLKSTAGNISDALVSMQSVISYVQKSWPYFSSVSDSALKTINSATEATGSLNSAAAAIADGVEGVRDYISNLAEQPEITLHKFNSEYRETQDQFSGALGNISKSLGSLNETLAGTSSMLLTDIQAISKQLFIVFDLLVGTVENISEISTNIKNYTEDISTSDADSDTEGKVSESINHGIVQGDVNAGGIAGSMSIEYDFDPEDDYNLTDKISIGSKYLLRVVVSGCENDGKITSKKNYAGGIVGLMDFGYVVESTDNGSVSSTDGNYVGGITGKSDGTIRRCYAKSLLSGKDYVGGIAGYGKNLYNCYSLIRVENASEFVGAIAGKAEGEMKGNYFVQKELAAVNGISYTGKAEPISYEKLISVKGLPVLFTSFRLNFVADGKELTSIFLQYGDTIPKDKIPNVPVKKGYFGEWDMNDFTDLTFDGTVEAVYKQYITTLASKQKRDNGLSAILVDGLFTSSSSLTVSEGERVDSFNGEPVLDQWTVSVTDDGKASHRVRYLAPGRQTSGIYIYILKNGKWKKTDYTVNGTYILFKMKGSEAAFIVTPSKSISKIILRTVLAVLAATSFVVLLMRKRGKKRQQQRGQKRKKAAQGGKRIEKT